MLTYTGGHTVAKGTYRNLSDGRRIVVAGEAVLAGAGPAEYSGMSSAVVLLSGPVIGFLYSMLMPVIGIATVAVLSARMVLGTLYHLAMKSVSSGWRPQNTYLSGRRRPGEARK